MAISNTQPTPGAHPKRIGFLSFGHWQNHPASGTRSAADSLLQTIDLAVGAEELGIDGAFVRVHHFARQLASPMPLLAAIAARTKRIEIGTGVIDMRYENPLYLAEETAATDLISGGRLQLGISRGSPGVAHRGPESFGYPAQDGPADSEMARIKTERYLAALRGEAVAATAPNAAGQAFGLAVQPLSPGVERRIWWGSGSSASVQWAASQGMNLMSSTLLLEDKGIPFDELQAEQIRLYREAWHEAGWDWQPRVSVSRSVIPIVSDLDRRLFGGEVHDDQVGILEGVRSRFGKSYAGSPEVIAEELSRDAAVRDADTLMLTVPNQLGVDYILNMLRIIRDHIAPAIGWKRATEASRTTA